MYEEIYIPPYNHLRKYKQLFFCNADVKKMSLLAKKKWGAICSPFSKSEGTAAPSASPFPTSLTYIYLLENSSTSDYLPLTVPNQHNSVDVSSKRKLLV